MNRSAGSIRKQMAQIHESILTAHHEAGHAIYGLLHFMKIDSIKIYFDKDYDRINGDVEYERYLPSDFSDPALVEYLMESQICINYAGWIAERTQFQISSGLLKLPRFMKSGSSFDFQTASKLLRKYQIGNPGKERFNIKQQLIQRTEEKLLSHWEAVTLLSHCLFKKKKLNFQDLKLLLTKKSNNKIFWRNQFRIIEKIYKTRIIEDKQLKKLISVY